MLTCKCNNTCPNVIEATAAAVSGASFIISTSSTITPKNGTRYLLKIPVSVLPTTALTTVYPVYVAVNDVNIPLQCIVGNDVFTDQLRDICPNACGNLVLRLVYGSTPSHFKIVSTRLCPSSAYGVTATAISTSGAKKVAGASKNSQE